MPMNPDIKARWVAALRSGEYQQGQKALCRNGAFCCLGVLSDLYIKETGKGGWAEVGDVEAFVYENYTEEFSELPNPVQDWAGIDSSAPVARSPGHLSDKYDLIDLNDAGTPFAKLADIIEAYM